MRLLTSPLISSISGRLKDWVYRRMKSGYTTIARRTRHPGKEFQTLRMIYQQKCYSNLDKYWWLITEEQRIEWARCTTKLRRGHLSGHAYFKQVNLRRLSAGMTALASPPDKFRSHNRRYSIWNQDPIWIWGDGYGKDGEPFPEYPPHPPPPPPLPRPPQLPPEENPNPMANQAPKGFPDEFDVASDDITIIEAPGVLANDTDPECDPLHAHLVEEPTYGYLDFFMDGAFKYTPKFYYEGPDFFYYYPCDGYNKGNVTLVKLNVGPTVPPVDCDADTIDCPEEVAECPESYEVVIAAGNAEVCVTLPCDYWDGLTILDKVPDTCRWSDGAASPISLSCDHFMEYTAQWELFTWNYGVHCLTFRCGNFTGCPPETSYLPCADESFCDVTLAAASVVAL